MREFVSALVLIFVAEMGDKTQLLAFALSTQYHYRVVLSGIFLGAFLNHGIAILLANIISKFSSMQYLEIVSAILFIFFGLISFKVKEEEEEAGQCKVINYFGIMLTVATCFFVGELGDKTQLTAMTLGLQSYYPMLTLLGTSVGMVLVSSVGIVIGKSFSSRINPQYVSIVSGFVFLLFGLGSILKLYFDGIIAEKFAFSVIGISILVAAYLVFELYRKINWNLKRVKNNI